MVIDRMLVFPFTPDLLPLGELVVFEECTVVQHLSRRLLLLLALVALVAAALLCLAASAVSRLWPLPLLPLWRAQANHDGVENSCRCVDLVDGCLKALFSEACCLLQRVLVIDPPLHSNCNCNAVRTHARAEGETGAGGGR